MPTFDPSSIPLSGSTLTPDYIRDTNKIVDALREKLVEAVPLAGEANGFARAASKIRIFTQAHIRRCLEFVDAGYAEYLAGRNIVARTCTRALLENIASFCDFADTVNPLVRSGDQEKVRECLDKAVFGTRIDDIIAVHGQGVVAKNILTQIDKMNKRFPNYRDDYEHLSDFVHPNALGVVVHYGSACEGSVVFHDAGREEGAAIRGHLVSSFLLTFVLIAIEEMEAAIREALGKSTGAAAGIALQRKGW